MWIISTSTWLDWEGKDSRCQTAPSDSGFLQVNLPVSRLCSQRKLPQQSLNDLSFWNWKLRVSLISGLTNSEFSPAFWNTPPPPDLWVNWSLCCCRYVLLLLLLCTFLLLLLSCTVVFFLLSLLSLLLCVYLSCGHSRPDLSVDLSLTKSFIETLVRRHGNSQNRAVGVTKLRAIGQLREYCVLVGQRDNQGAKLYSERELPVPDDYFFNSGNCKIG